MLILADQLLGISLTHLRPTFLLIDTIMKLPQLIHAPLKLLIFPLIFIPEPVQLVLAV